MKELNCLVFLSCVSVLTVSAESELISSQRPVEVLAGYDVILPCHLEPPINVRSETVLWSRSDLKPKYVHYHQDGRLVFEHQDPSYRFRTRLFMDELTKGNVSMKIFKVKMSDAGTYICSLPSMNKEASIQLRVEESDVIGSHEPVHVTVGHDVILPCHLEPPSDVTTLLVEWTWNESFVHVYRSRKDYLEDQNKKFKGRTSLFIDELDKGNISLKLINVTEQDAGNYTCFVQNLQSRVRNVSIILIVESEENRNKGKTDSDKKTEENNNNNNGGLYGLFALILVAAIVAIVVTVIRRKHVNNRQGGGERQPPQQPDPRAGNVQPDPPAEQGGGERQPPQQPDPRACYVQPGQGGAEPQEESELSAIAGNIQPGLWGKYKLDPRPDLGAGQDRVEPQEEREWAPRPGRRGKYKLPQRPGSVVRQRQVTTLAN